MRPLDRPQVEVVEEEAAAAEAVVAEVAYSPVPCRTECSFRGSASSVPSDATSGCRPPQRRSDRPPRLPARKIGAWNPPALNANRNCDSTALACRGNYQ